MAEKDASKAVEAIEIVGKVLRVASVGALVIGGAWLIGVSSYVYGTTPAQVETLSLEGTPAQIANRLTRTDVASSSVRARFKSSAKPYMYFELSWSSESPDAPTTMELLRGGLTGEEQRQGEVAALARRFHALHDGTWSWGRVTITAHDNGELQAHVEPVWQKKPNPLFARQMDAVRQILLVVAFGIRVHASDAELAELLGTGYKTTDVGTIDPQTTIDNVSALMTARFRGRSTTRRGAGRSRSITRSSKRSTSRGRTRPAGHSRP